MEYSENALRANQAMRITWIGLFANLAVTAVKYIAGIVGHSSAMIADATHSLSDSITDVALLFGFWVVKRPIDSTHDYGHGKAETMVAALCGVTLFGVGVLIFWRGAHSIYLYAAKGATLTEPGAVALFAAMLSIIIKEALYRYTMKWAVKLNSSAIMANAWDHRTDALSSVGALIGIGGAYFFGPKYRVLDPIAAVAVSLMVIKVACPMIKGSLYELMDGSLDEKAEATITDMVCGVLGVAGCHNLRTRKIGNAAAVEAHLLVDRHLSIVAAHDIASKAEDAIRDELGQNTFINLHVEPLGHGYSGVANVNNVEVRMFDLQRRDAMQFDKLRFVLKKLGAGVVISKGWVTEYPYPRVASQVASYVIRTPLDPVRMKAILWGLEYSCSGHRMCDFDIYVGNKKIYWNDAMKKDGLSGTRPQVGVHYRHAIAEQLGPDAAAELLEIDRNIDMAADKA